MTAPPDFDLHSGRFYADDAHASFSWMRAHDPLYLDRENNIRAVTKHADIMHVSKHADVFCSGRGFRPDSLPLPMMISMDRPEHMIRRNLVNSGFTPRRVTELEPRIRMICRGLIDRVMEKGECEFVGEVAAHLPLIVIGDLLGVVEEDFDKLLRWSDDLMKGLGSDDPELITRMSQAGAEYAAYNAEVVAQRRANPGGSDLMSLLVEAEIDGQRLDDFSIQMESLLVLIGGDETTRHVISGGMHQLALHPAQREELVADPTLIPGAVEEMLRWVTPIQNMMRTTTCETELRGVKLEAGTRLLLLYPSANRDEDVFDRPFEFDIHRQPNPHVAFGGYGNHFCLGNALARLELRVMFEELLPRLKDVELAFDGEPALRPANFVVGIEELPIRFRNA